MLRYKAWMAAKYAEHGIRIKEGNLPVQYQFAGQGESGYLCRDRSQTASRTARERGCREGSQARKKAAEAQGEADRLRIEAEGRAQAIDVEGRALARNPQILRLKEIEMQNKLAASAGNWQNRGAEFRTVRDSC